MVHISRKTILVWHKNSKNDLYDHLNWFVPKNMPKTSKNTHSRPIYTRFCALLCGLCVLEIPIEGSIMTQNYHFRSLKHLKCVRVNFSSFMGENVQNYDKFIIFQFCASDQIWFFGNISKSKGPRA